MMTIGFWPESAIKFRFTSARHALCYSLTDAEITRFIANKNRPPRGGACAGWIRHLHIGQKLLIQKLQKANRQPRPIPPPTSITSGHTVGICKSWLNATYHPN